jgi:cyclic pyranopterin phosphate synthase
MVEVGEKPETAREAVAVGNLRISAAAIAALQSGQLPKGDPLTVARIAGIQAAKRTAELIPLCHPLALTGIEVEVELDAQAEVIRARATVRLTGRTGVEMEALTAVTVALLTAYDMLKAVDREMVLEGIRLVRKTGGRSGTWEARESGT